MSQQLTYINLSNYSMSMSEEGESFETVIIYCIMQDSSVLTDCCLTSIEEHFS